MPKKDSNSQGPEERLGLSMLSEIKNEKKIQIITQSAFLEEYKLIPDNDNFLVEANSAKDAVSKACDSAFDNNLTICHIKAQADGTTENPKIWKKVSKITKKLWSHTSQNGMFITVWNGSKEQNAMVGIALKKQQID